MSDIVQIRDVASTLLPVNAGIVNQTAGATAAVVSGTIDRLDPNTGSLANALMIALMWSATLAATYTLSLGSLEIDTSPDGSTWTTWDASAALPNPGVVATGPAGGGTLSGVVKVGAALDFTGAMRYLRFKYTPTLSNTSADTFHGAVAAILAGYDRLKA